MKKTYVLDTNILLSNPESLFNFEDNEVVLPEAVLEELDDKKRGNEYINVNAREVARKLYSLKQRTNKTLFDGVDLDNGGRLFIQPLNELKNKVEFPSTWSDQKRDNDILKTCLYLKEKREKVILVTKDIFLGIKADDLGIENEDYKTDTVVNVDEQYTGQLEICLHEDDFNKYCKDGIIDISNAFVIETTENEYIENYNFICYPNQFLIIHNSMQYSNTKLG